MNSPLWFQNLVAYCAQIALLVTAGELLPRLFRLRAPRAVLVFWQLLLAACLALPVLQPWQRVPLRSTAHVLFGSIRMEGAARDAAARFPLPPHYEIAGAILLAGIAVRLGWFAIGLFRLNSFRRRARPLAPIPPAVEEVRSRLGASATFHISTEVASPVTFGEFRPVVLLPARFEEMADDRQRAVVCHELAHVRRHDWAFHLAEEIIRAVFWFHPAVWWLISRIRLAREQVVDGEVLRLLRRRKPYLEALLEIAMAQPVPRPVPAPLFLVERQLPQRIAAMLKEVSMSKPRLIASLAGVSGLLILAGGLAVWAFPLQVRTKDAAAISQIAKAGGELASTVPEANPLPANASASPRPNPEPSKNEKEKVYKVGGDVTMPVPIYKPEPSYTPEAKKAKLQGSLALDVTVDAAGNVRDVRVVHALGGGLTESAVNTVRTWKFKPATRRGKPVPVAVMVEVTFKFF